MENNIEITSEKCVNSNWKARFLCNDNEECCQCSFGECKVKVAITFNGHPPYTYVLSENEIESAKKVVFGNEYKLPNTNEILDSLDRLTIRSK